MYRGWKEGETRGGLWKLSREHDPLEHSEPLGSRAGAGAHVFRVRVQNSFHASKAPSLSWYQLTPWIGILSMSPASPVVSSGLSRMWICILFVLFCFVCLKYFVMMKYTEIKRLNGRPRPPIWIWALDRQTQSKGSRCWNCLKEGFCGLGSCWQVWVTWERLVDVD